MSSARLQSKTTMVIGIVQLELAIDGSRSLKDKRRVVTSLKDRLHRHHQVSVAEVGSLEDHRVAVLGIVLVSSSVPHCQRVFDHLLNNVRRQRGCVLSDHSTEILTGH